MAAIVLIVNKQTSHYGPGPMFTKLFLRGSGSRSDETTKWITWSKPEKWCSRNLFESESIDPTKWINLVPIVIDISCPTMHYGKFVCLLSTKWLSMFSLKQRIGQCHRLQDKHQSMRMSVGQPVMSDKFRRWPTKNPFSSVTMSDEIFQRKIQIIGLFCYG